MNRRAGPRGPYHVWSPGRGPYSAVDFDALVNVCLRCGLRQRWFSDHMQRRWFWCEIEAGVWTWVATLAAWGWTPPCPPPWGATAEEAAA